MNSRCLGTGPALLGAAVVVASMGALTKPAAAQDVQAALGRAPQSAEAVLIVPNLASLNEQIAQLKTNLGLPMPELDDALGAFKQSMGMVNGVNDDGSLIIAVPDLAKAIAEDTEPQFVMLMPVADYGAFVGNLAAGDAAPGAAAEGVAAISLPDGQPGFVRELDGYAVLGESRELVEGFQPGDNAQAIIQSVGQLGQRYLGDADMLFYVDLARLAPTLVPMIDEAMGQQAADVEGQIAAGLIDPAIAGNAQAILQAYADAGKALLENGTGLLVTLDLTDQGVALTQAMGYKPGSSLAEFFGEGRAQPQGLSQLPEQPFIFAAAVDMDALDIASLYRGFIESLPQGQQNPLAQNVEQWMPLIEQVNYCSSVFYAPTEMAMMSGSILNTVSVVDVDDPEAYLRAFKAYIQAMDGMKIPAGPNPLAGPGAEGAPAELTISYTSNFTENVLQLQGVQVDQYQLTTNLPPEMMQQMGPAAGFMTMFTNYSGYIAVKDGKVLITTTPDPQLVTKGFQTIEQGGGIGAAGAISRIRDDALPPNASAEAYISVGGIAQAANLFLGMFGMPPIQVPADLPPIAAGLGAQDNSAAYRVYVPLETIKFVVDTAQTLQNQMAAPGQAPNRGGPPPF